MQTNIALYTWALLLAPLWNYRKIYMLILYLSLKYYQCLYKSYSLTFIPRSGSEINSEFIDFLSIFPSSVEEMDGWKNKDDLLWKQNVLKISCALMAKISHLRSKEWNLQKESLRSIKLQRTLGKCVHRNAFMIFYFCIMVNPIWYPRPYNLSREAR